MTLKKMRTKFEEAHKEYQIKSNHLTIYLGSFILAMGIITLFMSPSQLGHQITGYTFPIVCLIIGIGLISCSVKDIRTLKSDSNGNDI